MVTWTGFTSATPGLVPGSIVTSTVNEAPAATGSFGGAASAVERGFGKSRGHREAGEEDAETSQDKGAGNVSHRDLHDGQTGRPRDERGLP